MSTNRAGSPGGHWIAASKALGRLVPGDRPYPHICDRTVAAEDTVSGQPLQVARWSKARYCAACAHDKHLKAQPSTPDPERPKPMPDNGSTGDTALAAAARGIDVHRSAELIADGPLGGRAVTTRVRAADVDYAEIRIRVPLSRAEGTARRQLGLALHLCRELLAAVAAIRPEALAGARERQAISRGRRAA